jgi:hypothetical protein
MEIVALAAGGAKLAGVRGRGQRGKDAPARPQHVSAACPRGRDTELPFGPGLRSCPACSYRRAGSAVLAASTTRGPPRTWRRRPGAPWPLAGHRLNMAPRRWQHGGDQVVQRPGQVVSADQDDPLTGAKMVNRTPRNRAVGRRGSQGARDEFLPRAGVAGRGGVNHPAPHGAVRADSGHDDPHQLSLSSSAAFWRVDGDDSGRARAPGRLHASLSAERVTVRAVRPVVSAAGFANRGRACPLRMTQRHEQPVAGERQKRKYRRFGCAVGVVASSTKAAPIIRLWAASDVVALDLPLA